MPATTSKISNETLEKIKLLRWKCRTDLAFLCREVLDYVDVDDYVHGPMMQGLQKFPVPTAKQLRDNDYWDGKTWRYTPIIPNPMQLPRVMINGSDGRKNLILVARSHMKTYINAQAHTIQWIINYPNITMAIFQSSGKKAEGILNAIKDIFKYNKKFRELFPEHCPPANKAADFGVMESFITCARDKGSINREPTVMALSIDKGTAGLHFNVIKYSDIVEPENTKNEDRIAQINKAYELTKSLLVTPSCWIDIEGTIYDEKDLYMNLIRQWIEEEAKGQKHEYKIHIQAVYKKMDPVTKKEQTKFDPSTYEWPFMENERGEYIPWWQKDSKGDVRFTYEDLEAERRGNPYVFSCQKLLRPKHTADGDEIFPANKFKTINRELYNQNVKGRIQYRTVAVDTAETTNERSNYSVISVCGWDNFNRCYVEEIKRGKWKPDELVENIFLIYLKYKPVVVKIEETSFVRGLNVYLHQRMEQLEVSIPLEFLKRENQVSKIERIQNTLQAPFNNNLLYFVEPYTPVKGDLTKASLEDYQTWEALKKELFGFPKPLTDDIIDTLADHFQNKEFYGRFLPRNQFPQDLEEKARKRAWNIWMGFEKSSYDS